MRVVGDLDQVFRLAAFGNLNLALFPHARNVGLPGLTHAADESVGAAEEKNVRTECVPAGEDAEILQDDGFKERCHQLVGRRAGFLEAVDVGFGEDAAFAGDFVQLDAVIALVGELGGGNLELGVDLVDDCAGAARALVVHRRDLFLAAGLFVVLEDDDLRVLPAELDDGIDLGVQLLDGERDGVDFLDELRADHLGDRAAAGSGDEDARVVG